MVRNIATQVWIIFLCLIMISHPVFAASNTMVLVPLEKNPTKESIFLHQKLKSALKKAKIDSMDFKEFQKKYQDGNLLFTQTEDFFLEYNLNAALKAADETALAFWGNPEAHEQLFKSHLLKAQIQKEMGRLRDAENSIREAIAFYPGQEKLNEAFYPPKFCAWYQNIYAKTSDTKTQFDRQKFITNMTSVGEKSGISQIVFTELNQDNPLANLTLTVIDVKTKTKFMHQFEGIHLKTNIPSVAQNVVRSLAHLEPSLINKPQTHNTKVASAGKKKMSKGLLWGLIGVVVVGAGVGAALGLSGGSSGSGPSTDAGLAGAVPSGP
ncbi:MAG: hypothetical protein A3G32_06755 [Deltaproteobacteria bacterium RIFCSPLOWO2_12_FULL_40_28]|nr:MAG: hypothetical protein A3C45_06800 [Deltaproteobacteria bacterium RIFCSPHIGHO2_02_FULL_40_28]OGQ19341.1 MAG: hypothetical protein A3E27_05015 [Deltaproteobacteria bacterium RIFCSPHIGHO2_12_FULL_40_32]OGQ40435.1 MAG: hypothetical protein A3I69_00055 [Deltaproteobacteria bacterium RIFCSPLOWO2_02_FULL_40_36]OGQ53671.1 MAG: hypothetical protein A3G32_06755 [Deltaproteobacteria bacterium RIFCSPLOWO2_12_FULL_40_28]